MHGHSNKSSLVCVRVRVHVCVCVCRSVDKLLVAEDLVRRVIAVEADAAVAAAGGSSLVQQSAAGAAGAGAEGGSGARSGAGNPRTRKLLADILAGQNQAVRAVQVRLSLSLHSSPSFLSLLHLLP